jgi:hypothetical protein
MFPFEVHGDDGRLHLHRQKFREYLVERTEEYPANWAHARAEIEIVWPRWKLRDVPLNEGESHNIKIRQKDWSVIFDAFPAHNHCSEEGSWILLIEKGHERPCHGEEVEMYYTGDSIFDASARFCFFRGQFWKVINFSGGKHGWHQPPGVKRIKYRSIDDD